MAAQTRIFLIGPMGAGKSAVGRAVAQRIKYRFADTDSVVEKTAGVDIPFIFEKEQEEGFRLREHRALASLCEQPRHVVATGGGCVVTPANRDLLERGGLVIYLRASVGQLYERVRLSQNRPLLHTDDPKAALTTLVRAREPLYQSIADMTIDTDGQKVHAVAERISARLTDEP